MDVRELDARLREVFRQNAPPPDQSHLAAALHPGTSAKPAHESSRSSNRKRGRRTPRAAAITAVVLLLAAAVGIGVWKVAGYLGEDKAIILITDPPISPADGGTVSTLEDPQQAGMTMLLDMITDGVWEFRVDRSGRVAEAHLPSDWLPETAYKPMEDPPTFRVVVSENGARVSVEEDWASTPHVAHYERVSVDAGRIWYDLDPVAMGRFVIWPTADGLQAEETLYGSGLPMLRSVRGSLVKVGGM